jgi:hypothetical protein
MSEETNFVVELKQIEDYQFKVKFDWPNVADLLLDEPQPLGQSAGPNAARLIAARGGELFVGEFVVLHPQVQAGRGI